MKSKFRKQKITICAKILKIICSKFGMNMAKTQAHFCQNLVQFLSPDTLTLVEHRTFA